MTFSSILITGASSGIGAALARVHAAPGVRLTLWGRDAGRLAAVAADCAVRGALCRTAAFDLADLDRLASELAAADADESFDLVLLSAGLGGSLPASPVGQEEAAARAMIAVDFTAPVLAANRIGEAMAARGRGRIVLIGSVAADFPLPMAPVYSGAKAGLGVFAEALGLRLGRYGVGVTLVTAGFVDTPMSRQLTEPRPFLISAETAAEVIARKAAAGARHVVVPWPFALIRAASRLLPRAVLLAILGLVERLTTRN